GRLAPRWEAGRRRRAARGRDVISALLGSDKRLSWRRLVVFVAGTALLWAERLDGWQWVSVACLYIGGEIAERLAGRIGQTEPAAIRGPAFREDPP
ncbi:MAG: hypothetical protein ABIL09_19645, partial [Gemmatimonadota bacterium]